MRLIAIRPEYQLTVDPDKNRLFYQNFERMQCATSLPHYLADWEAALTEVSPGFCVLSDMQVVNQTHGPLLCLFDAVAQRIRERGASLVAEVHVPGLPTRHYSDEITISHLLPVRHFLSVWEAAQFLDIQQGVPVTAG